MTDGSTNLPAPDAICDGGDLDCGSGLLLIIRTAMSPLSPGAHLLVKSRERSVREDLPAWCRLVGHTLVHDHGTEGATWHFLIRKKEEDSDLDMDIQKAKNHTWQARARWTSGMAAKVTVRNHGLVVGQPASFDTQDEAPSAVEYLLTALAGALTTGFQWRLSQQQIEVRNLEIVCKCKLVNSLVFLGVNDNGDPGVESVDVQVYVDATLPEKAGAGGSQDSPGAILQNIWNETMYRCPVTRTLERRVAIRSRLQLL